MKRTLQLTEGQAASLLRAEGYPPAVIAPVLGRGIEVLDEHVWLVESPNAPGMYELVSDVPGSLGMFLRKARA